MPFGGPGGFASALVLGVFTVVLIALPALPTHRDSPSAVPPVSALSTANQSLTYHANLSVNDPSPAQTVPPGTTLGVEFGVKIPGWDGAGGAATIAVPTGVAVLATANASLRVYLTSSTVNVPNSTWLEVQAGPALRLAASTTFNASTPALFSSQGLALMGSWPAGNTSAVDFRWRWVLSAPDGSLSDGPWSVPQQVWPAPLVSLASGAPKLWPIYGSYPICLSGALGGRTFSVHLSLSNPISQLTTSTVSVPLANSGMYCWNSSTPSAVAAQQAFIHLWEYANVSYLLLTIMVQLVNSSGSSAVGGVFNTGNWGPILLAAAGVIGAVGAAVVFFVWRPLRLRGTVSMSRGPVSEKSDQVPRHVTQPPAP